MDFDVFILMLTVASVLTGLTMEAIKKMLGEKMQGENNIVAAVISVIVAIVVGVVYCFLHDILFDAKNCVYVAILAFASWLCAMNGYDKIMQTIDQIKGNVKK